MNKLWCIFLMQLFKFTPLKRYDLCAGALALTLGGPKLECYGTGERIEAQSKNNGDEQIVGINNSKV